MFTEVFSSSLLFVVRSRCTYRRGSCVLLSKMNRMMQLFGFGGGRGNAKKTHDEDLYGGFDAAVPITTEDLAEDEGFQQAVRTSYGSRPPV